MGGALGGDPVHDGDLLGAENFEGGAGDDGGGVIVEVDAKELRVLGDQGRQVVEVLVGGELVVDGAARKEAESVVVAFAVQFAWRSGASA